MMGALSISSFQSDLLVDMKDGEFCEAKISSADDGDGDELFCHQETALQYQE